jgi:hypothetical protein
MLPRFGIEIKVSPKKSIVIGNSLQGRARATLIKMKAIGVKSAKLVKVG